MGTKFYLNRAGLRPQANQLHSCTTKVYTRQTLITKREPEPR